MKRLLFLSLCLLLVPGPGSAQSPEQKKATIAYLQSLQNRDGTYGASARDPQPSLRATNAVLRALKYFGGEPKNMVLEYWMRGCFNRGSGGFADRPGGPVDVGTTAVGIMAAVEAKMQTEPYAEAVVKYLGENAREFDQIRIAAAALEALGKRPPQADKWLEQVAKMRNPDGTYGKGDGKARETGGAVVVVLRLGGKVEHPDEVLKTLKAGQREDGGFGKAGAAGSDLETTYRVMRAFHMMKAQPEGDRCRAFIARCRNEDGGYGVAPGQPSTAGATYYAAIILHWLEEK
jgi:hypothetical protein